MIKTQNNSVVLFRTKKSVKDKAAKIFSDLGLDMSTGLNIYLNRVVATHSIPFRVVTENGYTPEFEKSILADLADKSGIKSYSSIKEMYDDVQNWED